MSLDWNISKVANYTLLQATEKGSRMTQEIVFETMAIGIGRIKDAKTAVEFKVRSDFWRTLDGLDVIPLAEIERRIGLYTNVSTETWASFVKRTAEGWKRDTQRKIGGNV